MEWRLKGCTREAADIFLEVIYGRPPMTLSLNTVSSLLSVAHPLEAPFVEGVCAHALEALLR